MLAAQASALNTCISMLRMKYRPKDNPDPQPVDVTVIGVHGNASPKEVYEQIWCDLHAQSKAHGFCIRGIWVADVAHEDYSHKLNEQLLSNDPARADHARDLLLMATHFRSEMPRPIVGIAHSFGGNILVQLALLHPRLLSALVLYDSVINVFTNTQVGAIFGVRLANARRDSWPTHKTAIESFCCPCGMFSTWDSRALKAWIGHALRDAPEDDDDAAVGDGNKKKNKNKVVLATPRHQKAFTYFRPLYPHERPDDTVAPDFDPAFNNPPELLDTFEGVKTSPFIPLKRWLIKRTSAFQNRMRMKNECIPAGVKKAVESRTQYTKSSHEEQLPSLMHCAAEAIVDREVCNAQKNYLGIRGGSPSSTSPRAAMYD
ncbi:hypothetical protein F5Y08DRAFT_345475 [Xylaria arbuscula]|nr:hypothetical protein F5Y08DRAFT_345475 [Xylaria arbuscula]